MVNHPTSHKYPASVLSFVARTLPIYDIILQHPDKQVRPDDLTQPLKKTQFSTFINPVNQVFFILIQQPGLSGSTIVVQFLTDVSMLQDLLATVYGLFVSVGESHPRLLLNALPNDTTGSCLRLINTVLACSNAPGHYPTNECYSHLGFGFWYILQVFRLQYGIIH